MLQNWNCVRIWLSNKREFNLIVAALMLTLTSWSAPVLGQEADFYDDRKSVPRNWNEALLFAIRRDFARPTVHARNLFHTAAVTYDAWAVFQDTPTPYFIGARHPAVAACEFSSDDKQLFSDEHFSSADQRRDAVNQAISFASLRLLNHRFAQSPGKEASLQRFADLFAAMGYNANNTDTDLRGTTPAAALGNRIATCAIEVGATDGSNEADNYANQHYQPVNTPLNPIFSGTPGLIDPDRWQPLQLDSFIDQSGNPTDTPVFLGAEWGQVTPFALEDSDITLYSRDGVTYRVYHDPGPPALLSDAAQSHQHYQWGHSLVAIWSSHLDPTDGVMWDVSPASIGNSTDLPADLPVELSDLQNFYQRYEGGSTDQGHAINPSTGAPYTPQLVPRGDYTRVLAEFWADGPDSETPPGHWFEILNKAVSDHPEFEKKLGGTGAALDDLTFDVYAYFILGAAMHDSAISAWSIKGWYDYIRPISALRYLSTLGQSSDNSAANFDARGIQIEPGFIESVEQGDILAGNGGRNIGKIKVQAWRGPSFVQNPDTDFAGVDWILLENWWPYQRPTFVTPPFAGYISGHSTFSRAAAEVLARLTGNEYFPGGMAEFLASKDEFLVFENGPSVDVRLQWATFKDASDQTSLSRIWGGIHPPVDDIPGRLVGVKVANKAYDKALAFFDGTVEPINVENTQGIPTTGGGALALWWLALLVPILAVRNTTIRIPRDSHTGTRSER